MGEKTIQALKGHLLAAKALKDSMDRSLASTIDKNPWRYTSYRTYMAKYQQIAQQVAGLVEITAPLSMWDLQKIKGSLETAGIFQQELFEAVYTNLNLLIAFLEHSIGIKSDEIKGIRDFFQANLRRAVFNEPTKEKEIQDVVEQLLIGRGFNRGVDYDRETGRVNVSIKEVIPDFIIPRLSMAVGLSKSSFQKIRPRVKLL